MPADSSGLVSVYLITTVGGPLHELQPILIDPRATNLGTIVKDIVSLTSPLHRGTKIAEILKVYSGRLRVFLSWAPVLENPAGLQNMSDCFLTLDTPHSVKEFLKYYNENKQACFIVEMLSQKEYDWKTNLRDFCRANEIFTEDQKALVKLRMEPGNEKFNTLSREEWQGFGGLSEIAYQSLVEKNREHAYALRSKK